MTPSIFRLGWVVGIVFALWRPTLVIAQDADALAGMQVASKVFRSAAKGVAKHVVVIEGLAGNEADAGPSTGLLVSDQGEVLTSTFNLRTNPRTITVKLSDGSRVLAKMLGRDETRKIALLRLEKQVTVASYSIVPRQEIRPGMWVVAVGGASGIVDSAASEKEQERLGPLSVGIISATARLSAKTIQTDANLNPSNYGGPLVDLEGKVIGISVPFVPGAKSEADNAQWYDAGVGFVVPLDGLAPILERMRKGEVLKAGILGAEVKATKGETNGIVLGKLVPGLPAEKGGLQPGDRVVRLQGRKVLDASQFKALLGEHLSGDKITVVVVREGGEKELSIELAESPVVKQKDADKKEP